MSSLPFLKNLYSYCVEGVRWRYRECKVYFIKTGDEKRQTKKNEVYDNKRKHKKKSNAQESKETSVYTEKTTKTMMNPL